MYVRFQLLFGQQRFKIYSCKIHIQISTQTCRILTNESLPHKITMIIIILLLNALNVNLQNNMSWDVFNFYSCRHVVNTTVRPSETRIYSRPYTGKKKKSRDEILNNSGSRVKTQNTVRSWLVLFYFRSTRDLFSYGLYKLGNFVTESRSFFCHRRARLYLVSMENYIVSASPWAECAWYSVRRKNPRRRRCNSTPSRGRDMI